ncbi:hypothetical protein CLNEO_13730 [Anaerotignum neopropionicum]|uniref:HTH cro/C1-type domain-containing protein n=1 Tax=Anaerotignum neopropionicum TaxID=36847 RepID=A0A136WFS0_9FIRM|nr:helix-turn-helix transcriptional regulator [Anaerotignum neopropionicum]KXL53402.1 hypothetical protein CLNEO_13730 [Anaerotignum neopropionicum]
MLLDNPIKRIKITDEIKSLIISERQKKDLSATQLAKKMERPQSWIAQIENGRTKSIKQSDLVLVFSKILDLTMEEADNFISNTFEEDLNSLYTDDSGQMSFLDKKDIKKDINKYAKFTTSENKEEFQTQKRYILSAFNSMYNQIPEEAVKILRTLCRNIDFNLPFMTGIMSIPFFILKDLDEDITHELYEEISNLFLKYANKDEQRVSIVNEDDNLDEEQ